MAINPGNYNHRGGGNYGIVLLCPNLVADDRLVYFDHNRDRTSWVIRDFIGGRRLDNNASKHTVVDIEADATFDEFPVWCNVETMPRDWRTYLALRTTAVRRLGASLTTVVPPNPNSGKWSPL